MWSKVFRVELSCFPIVFKGVEHVPKGLNHVPVILRHSFS